MTIRLIAPVDVDAARRLLLDNGWSGRRFEPEPFAAMLAGSYQAFVAVDDGRVVGFARSVSDGVSNGYLCTLVVAPGGDEPDMTWVLRAERPGLFPFYEKLGFARSQVTMERVRASRR